MAFDVPDDAPVELFFKLCKRVVACVSRHENKRGGKRYEDCYVREDCLGPPQIEFYVIALDVLTPALVSDLQKTLTGYPRWEIIAIVCPPDNSGWPEMGLRIREREVIDALQRRFFPPKFQNLRFESARPPDGL